MIQNYDTERKRKNIFDESTNMFDERSQTIVFQKMTAKNELNFPISI
jgi:ABC-type bacteriocin/lantibiotic exporter with double-glycine peptidase domain